MQHLQRRSLGAQRALTATIGLSFVFLLGSAALMLKLAREAERADRLVAQTVEVKQHLAAILAQLTQAESGERGYLLTRDETLLAPYMQARASIPRELSVLRQRVADNPQQLTRVDELAATLERRFAGIDDALQLSRQGRHEEAVQYVRSRGQRTMNVFVGQIGGLNRAEDELLMERQQRVAVMRERFLQAVAAMLVSCGVLALFALVSVRRHVATLESSQQLLRDQNRVLEERVKERTREFEHTAEVAMRERNRAEALLTDVSHRVGNNLALVSSFLTLQKRLVSHPEAARALDGARARVQAIASAHRKLRLGADFATVRANEVLTAVIEDISAGLPLGEGVHIDCELEPLEINARDAVSLGILTSELVMNAVKHAFAAGESGRVQVRFGRSDEAAAFIEVADDGRGWHGEQPPECASLGGKIVDMVARQFGGHAQRAPHRDDDARPGTRIRIELNKLQLVQHPAIAPQ